MTIRVSDHCSFTSGLQIKLIICFGFKCGAPLVNMLKSHTINLWWAKNYWNQVTKIDGIFENTNLFKSFALMTTQFSWAHHGCKFMFVLNGVNGLKSNSKWLIIWIVQQELIRVKEVDYLLLILQFQRCIVALHTTGHVVMTLLSMYWSIGVPGPTLDSHAVSPQRTRL